MELRDFIVTPFWICIVLVVAWLVRSRLTDDTVRQYFFPALFARIAGALALGFIYQFYYDGGDTYNYHTHGSRHIWEAFTHSFAAGFKLLLNSGDDYTGVYRYASKIAFYQDPQSFVIVRIAAVFDLLTFSTYSATAILFAAIAFFGSWFLFLTFYNIYPQYHRKIAIAALFLPSVFFWGSGLLKDTITLAAIGFITYGVYRTFILRSFTIRWSLMMLLSFYLLYIIKIYILMAFLPGLMLWIFFHYFSQIRSRALQIMLFPLVCGVALASGFWGMKKAAEDNPKYALENLAKTAQETAYDIRYWTGKDAGSGYTLGELDGTWGSLLRLAPEAINVSLFRPYIWEVRNPLMLLSALESGVLLLLTLYIIFVARGRALRHVIDPPLLFCFVFSIAFAFAVGVSTFNFGTLTRYKIPLMPYFFIAVFVVYELAKRERKLAELDSTE